MAEGTSDRGFDSADEHQYDTADSSAGSRSAGGKSPARSLTPPVKRDILGEEKDLASALPASPASPFVSASIGGYGVEHRVTTPGPLGGRVPAGEHRQPLLAERDDRVPLQPPPFVAQNVQPSGAFGAWAHSSAALRPEGFPPTAGRVPRPEFLNNRIPGSNASTHQSASLHYSDADSRATATFGIEPQESVPAVTGPSTYPSLSSTGPAPGPPGVYQGRAADSIRSLMSGSGSRQSRNPRSDAPGSDSTRSSALPLPSAPPMHPQPAQGQGPSGFVQKYNMDSNNPTTSAYLIEGREYGRSQYSQAVQEPVTIEGYNASNSSRGTLPVGNQHNGQVGVIFW